jgi:hypothetical protein
MKKIGLIEVWLGKVPDYFRFHLETIRHLSNIDFYFFTDDKSFNFDNYSNTNFHPNLITKIDFLERFNKVSKVKIVDIFNPKKITDFKLLYFEMFSEYISNYEFFGVYDIDTLFGDINSLLIESIKKYDFISVGDEVFHNRLSGPLIIFKNKKEILDLFHSDRFYEVLMGDSIYGYGEQELSVIAMNNYKTKIIHSMNTETNNGGKTTYNVCWSGGKLQVNDEEKMIYHFYRKNHTVFNKIGNKIYGRYNKKFINDFYWVFGFTENYSDNVKYLMESIHNYSNRKCVIYTINFDYKLPDKFITSEQFIFRRIDIEEGKKDSRGRDENIISCKPKLMIDVIDFLPNKKFIFMDSDVYLTTTSDDFGKYFSDLENYPLINQHTHDKLYLSGIVDGEDWTSTVDILAQATNTEIKIFPRRKTNVMLFDENSKWFFQEQLQMYEQYKNTKPGIFTLHDEDSANVILSKYSLNKSLHLCDIEESSNLNMSKFTDMDHPFHMTGLSEFLVLPKHQNDIFCFHGLKHEWQYRNIQNDYGNSVIDCEEILVYYQNETIFFEKNSFLSNKKINDNVDFIVKTIDGQVIETLLNQNLFQYWVFYISNISLPKGSFIIEVVESVSKNKIYNNLLKI